MELEDALQIVRKPRAGDAIFVYRQANLDRLFALPDPPRHVPLEAVPGPSGGRPACPESTSGSAKISVQTPKFYPLIDRFIAVIFSYYPFAIHL